MFEREKRASSLHRQSKGKSRASDYCDLLGTENVEQFFAEGSDMDGEIADSRSSSQKSDKGPNEERDSKAKAKPFLQPPTMADALDQFAKVQRRPSIGTQLGVPQVSLEEMQ